MSNFWEKLNKPFFLLAPMADVTDCVFREIITKYGKPDVFWTEFVSADGLAHPEARERLMIDFKYSQEERPIVAQIFSGNPDNMREATKLVVELGFDGVDINMGCPDRKVEKQKAGAYCTKDPEHARRIIRAVKEGADGKIPVSVKTRLGYNSVSMDFLRAVLEEGVVMLAIHLRTRKEMSKVPARWELMEDIVALRDEVAPETLIVGNGDVMSLKEGQELCEKYGCDGVMVGRGIFGNPWFFRGLKNRSVGSLKRTNNFLLKIFSARAGRSAQGVSDYQPSLEEKLRVMVEHTKLYEKALGPHKNFAIMKKHYKAYANGFPGSKDLRIKLMECDDASEVEKVVAEFLDK